jgi:phospholipid transport system substrate-binding protein
MSTEYVEDRTPSLAFIRSMVAAFPYRCMSAIRVLAPYLFAIAFVVLQSPAVHAAETPSEIFVQQNLDKGLAVLNDNRLEPQQRDAQFRDLLLSVTDVKRVALFTLGQYARGASDAQINSFVNAFANYFTSVFQHNLDRNMGGTVEVTGSKVRAPDDVIVTARLITSDASHSRGTPVNVAFRVRKNPAGADTVVDLQVEGVSMALTERDEFTAYLQQHGGNVGALSAELEDRATGLRTGDSLAQTQNAKGAAKPTPAE